MRKYQFKKGWHYTLSFWHFGITFKKKIAFKAMFDKSCLYDLKDNDNYDINKLFGFSTTYFHHNQSARIGWRRKNDESIELVTYTYNNHERLAETILGTVKPGEEFTCSIEDIESDYIYTFKGKDYNIMVRNPKQPDKVLFKYLLYPYFGGNKPAPHDMFLYLERI